MNGTDVMIRVGGGEQAHAETGAVKAQGKPVIEHDLPVTPQEHAQCEPHSCGS